MIIGQKALQSKIKVIIGLDRFPRFALFVGPDGSGKRTIMDWTATQLHIKDVIKYDKAGVDQVRSMITFAYQLVNPTVFIMPNIHTMSTSAKNAILKVTEEPPNKAYFLMSTDSLGNTLDTVRSRSVTFQMQPYNQEELTSYIDSQNRHISDGDKHFILSVSNNISDIQKLLTSDISEFSEYVNLVIDKIATVSGPNSFKVVNKLAVKGEEDKYDPKLFFQAFQSICLDKLTHTEDREEMNRYTDAIEITSKAVQELSINGINKQMLVDDWILKIRKAWS